MTTFLELTVIDSSFPAGRARCLVNMGCVWMISPAIDGDKGASLLALDRGEWLVDVAETPDEIASLIAATKGCEAFALVEGDGE